MEHTNLDYEIFIYENRGWDVLPFLLVLKNIDLESDWFILKLHTKKSQHREQMSGGYILLAPCEAKAA